MRSRLRSSVPGRMEGRGVAMLATWSSFEGDVSADGIARHGRRPHATGRCSISCSGSAPRRTASPLRCRSGKRSSSVVRAISPCSRASGALSQK